VTGAPQRQGARKRVGPAPTAPAYSGPAPRPTFPPLGWPLPAPSPAPGAGAVPLSLGGTPRSAPAAAECSGTRPLSPSASRCFRTSSPRLCECPRARTAAAVGSSGECGRRRARPAAWSTAPFGAALSPARPPASTSRPGEAATAGAGAGAAGGAAGHGHPALRAPSCLGSRALEPQRRG
jgi:hypothetical protein